jgi:hypothetical protein
VRVCVCGGGGWNDRSNGVPHSDNNMLFIVGVNEWVQ